MPSFTALTSKINSRWKKHLANCKVQCKLKRIPFSSHVFREGCLSARTNPPVSFDLSLSGDVSPQRLLPCGHGSHHTPLLSPTLVSLPLPLPSPRPLSGFLVTHIPSPKPPLLPPIAPPPTFRLSFTQETLPTSKCSSPVLEESLGD